MDWSIKMNRQCGLVLAACLVFAGAVGIAQSPGPIEYEAFCKLPDTQAKRSAFLATTPESRATLVRTQLERWRDANQARLRPEQVAFLAELIATITPDTYRDGPVGEEQRVKSRAVAEKARGLFTDADIQAMQPYAACIQKSK
jgi:hypothetical protein